MTQVIDSEINKFEHSRYRIKARLVPNGASSEEEELDIGKAVSELFIYKNYDEQAFPYYRLTAMLSKVVAARIYECWRDAKMYITLTRYIAVNDDQTNEEFTGDYYNNSIEFRIMVINGVPPPVQDGVQDDMAAARETLSVVLELAPSIPLEINRRILNGAFHDLKIIDLIASLTSANKPKSDYRFLLSTTDNMKVYETIFLPPLNYVASLRHLDRVYGMYAGKLVVFLDLKFGYILSSTKITVANGEVATTTAVQHMAQSEAAMNNTGSGGSWFDYDSTTHHLRTFFPLQIAVDGPARKEVGGEQIKLVNMSTEEHAGSVCKRLDADSVTPKEAGNSKERVVWQRYDNPLVVEKLRVESRESYAPQVLMFSSCDLEAFQPNLQWIITSNVETNKMFEGAWRISAMEAVLRKAPSTDETASVEVKCVVVPSTATKAAT